MKKIAFLSDLLFAFFIAFLFTLLFFRYLRIELYLAVTLACLCGALVTFSIGAYLYSKRKNIFLKKSEAVEREKFALHLALSGNEANAELLKNFFSRQNPPLEIKRTGKNRLTSANEVYYLLFTIAPVTADEIAPFTRLKTHRKKILLCNKTDETAQDICNRFDIQIKTSENLFTEMKQLNALPTAYLGDKTHATLKKQNFKLWFAKSNSRRFLLSAVLILLLSRFTPFYYYYLVFAVLLLFAAIFIRIFGKE